MVRLADGLGDRQHPAVRAGCGLRREDARDEQRKQEGHSDSPPTKMGISELPEDGSTDTILSTT